MGERFARIFRQNMYNCGLLALELPKGDIEVLFSLGNEVDIRVDLDRKYLEDIRNSAAEHEVARRAHFREDL